MGRILLTGVIEYADLTTAVGKGPSTSVLDMAVHCI